MSDMSRHPATGEKAVLYRMVMPHHVCPYGVKADHLLRSAGKQPGFLIYVPVYRRQGDGGSAGQHPGPGGQLVQPGSNLQREELFAHRGLVCHGRIKSPLLA